MTTFQKIQEMAAKCSLCELHKGRIKPVFARGGSNSKVMIVGMCPGPDENKVGTPFIGKAGEVLDAILSEAFGDYKNDLDVYITNLVKCFVPPGTELKKEWMTTCLPYFVIQIGLVKPEVIIALGKDVSNFLLENSDPMKNMRGRIYTYNNKKLISTYHPSYLARGGGVKHRDFNKVVNDFRQVMEII